MQAETKTISKARIKIKRVAGEVLQYSATSTVFDISQIPYDNNNFTIAICIRSTGNTEQQYSNVYITLHQIKTNHPFLKILLNDGQKINNIFK
jgi:hypothetical protein